jgi:hypothetical protein
MGRCGNSLRLKSLYTLRLLLPSILDAEQLRSSRYLSQLRLLATGYASFPADLRREMTRSPFLLGVRWIPVQTASGDFKASSVAGDEETQMEYILARASDIVIVDDSYLAKLFSDAFIGAPEVCLVL